MDVVLSIDAVWTTANGSGVMVLGEDAGCGWCGDSATSTRLDTAQLVACAERPGRCLDEIIKSAGVAEQIRHKGNVVARVYGAIRKIKMRLLRRAVFDGRFRRPRG